MAEAPAKLENPSLNLVLGQSEDSPRTARTLGLSSDGVHGLNSDSPRTVLGLSEYLYFIIIIIIIIEKCTTPGLNPGPNEY